MIVAAEDTPINRNAVLYSNLGSPELSAPDEYLIDPATSAGTLVRVDRDGEIIAQGDKAGYCFQITSGCVRAVKLIEGGRRQVGEFLFARDIFGWEALSEHEFAVEAVTPVVLRRFRLSTIEEFAANDRLFARKLQRYIVAKVQTGRAHLVLLGRKTAAERISSFLLEMLGRPSGCTTSALDLPMSRADIADYLGLTIETVCRELRNLHRRGVIVIRRGRIVISDHRALRSDGSVWLH